MSYWDIISKVNKMVKDHEKSRTKNRVVPWWNRDEFVRRGPDKREKKQLEKEWWKNWEKLEDDRDSSTLKSVTGDKDNKHKKR